jgi:hypothetical protein
MTIFLLRWRAVAICGCAIATLFSAAQPCAASEDLQAEGRALLSKTLNITDIRSPGSAPFVLAAKVHIEDHGKGVDGLYATSWAEPTKFRRSVSFPTFTETDVAIREYVFKRRNTEAVPLLVWQVNRMMDSFFIHQFHPSSKIMKIFAQPENGAESKCIEFKEGDVRSTICLREDTSDPVSVDIDSGQSPVYREHYQFDDYQPFEGKRFPRSIRFTGWGSRSVEIKVERFLLAQAFADHEFTPLPESTRFVVCPNEPGGVADGGIGLATTRASGFGRLEAALYLEVGPDGAVRYGEVVYSSAPVQNKNLLAVFLHGRFPVRSCNGRPVAYEIMMRLAA